MKIWSFLAAIFVLCCVHGTGATRPAFAYSQGHTLTFANAQGHPLTTLTVRQGIGGFAIDPSARHVVVQTPGDYGGQLLWCSIRTKKCTRLTHGPYFFKGDKDSREVYADPAFDPTGKRLAFAIHTVFRNPSWAREEDAVEASGPLALMKVSNRGVQTVDPTAGLGGCFTSSPLWSPDGLRVLFSCGDGGLLANSDGTHLLDLSDTMAGPPPDKSMSSTSPLMWLGNDTILFLRAPGSSETDWKKGQVFELNLANMSVGKIKCVGGIPASDLQGAVYMQNSKSFVLVNKFGGEEKVYDRQTGKVIWSALYTQSCPVFAQLIAEGAGN